MIGFVEDKHTFSNFTFLKNRLRNTLGEHLDCTIRMYTTFTLQDFPFLDANSHWLDVQRKQGLWG